MRTNHVVRKAVLAVEGEQGARWWRRASTHGTVSTGSNVFSNLGGCGTSAALAGRLYGACDAVRKAVISLARREARCALSFLRAFAR